MQGPGPDIVMVLCQRLEVFHPRLEASSVSESWANSFSWVVNREAPQFRQTDTFGKTHTAGLVAFLRPGKWKSISAGNSA